MTKTWLTEAQPEQFEGFLQTLWASMRETTEDLPEEIPQGVGEIPAVPWPLGYAVDNTKGFAAFRWYQPAADNLPSVPLRCEAFFLTPANAAPRIGLRIHAAGSAVDNLTTPAWWGNALGLPDALYEGSLFPGFIELVAILSARGNIATSSADVQEALSELQLELAYFRQLSDGQVEENRQLRARLREIAERPVFQPVIENDTEAAVAEPPSDLSGIAVWSAQHSDRITVMSRALYGAKKSIYQDPPAVYAALELLAGPYRDHRMGIIDKDAFNAAMAAAGLQLAGSVGASVAGEQGDAYFVHWRGRKRFLDMHLLKGGGRDERYCLRVYFFWDDETQQPIVGWLPSHLSNSLS